ncbi:MAG: hypothetical protein GY792_13010 [Gammaproteobacteria bacterium]|nr:hypothetical protein [Gammaproteobacteria bacterium]
MPANQLLLEQLPVFVTSLLIAELFYKFHSFTLECVAFLATWYVLDGVVRFFVSSRKGDEEKCDL